MIEQNNTTKLGRIRRFFRWVFVAVKWLFVLLLAILLIAGLYFQAPWKVITLIAIILATLTIIPKRTRKWICLTFGIIIIALVVWVFLPEDDGDWRPYTFDEELAALEAKRAIPEEQNAATIYNKLLEQYDSNDFEPEFMDRDLEKLSRRELWSTKDYPELANWIQGHKETITILMQACERDLCRFPLRPDMIGLEDTTERLSPMRDWARLLIRAGNNDVGNGEIDDGIKKHVAVLQMAEHLYQQPSIIERLVAIAIEALGRSKITRLVVLGDVTEERLGVLDKSLGQSKHDWASDWSSTLEYEKLLNKNLLAMFYEVNSKGKVRFSHDPTASARRELEKSGHEFPQYTYWHKKLAKSHAILAWFYVPCSPQAAAKIIDASYERYYAMAEPDFNWQKGPVKAKSRLKLNYRHMTEMMAQIVGDSYYSIHDLYLRNISDNRAAQLVIALRRYKNEHDRWPDSLEDVKSLAPPELFVDPINNDSFVYRPTEDSFTLYSKGKNNIDEDGLRNIIFDPNDPKWPETKEDDLLIWPPKSRK